LKFVARVTSIFDHSLNVMIVVASVIFCFLFLAVNADVIMRYALHSPLDWLLEVGEFGLVYITVLGLAWLLREEGHVKVDFALNLFKPRTQALITTITSAISALFLLFVIIFGLVDTFYFLQFTISVGGYREYGAFRMPTVALLFPFAFGLLLFFLQFVRRTHKHWKAWRQGSEIKLGIAQDRG